MYQGRITRNMTNNQINQTEVDISKSVRRLRLDEGKKGKGKFITSSTSKDKLPQTFNLLASREKMKEQISKGVIQSEVMKSKLLEPILDDKQKEKENKKIKLVNEFQHEETQIKIENIQQEKSVKNNSKSKFEILNEKSENKKIEINPIHEKRFSDNVTVNNQTEEKVNSTQDCETTINKNNNITFNNVVKPPQSKTHLMPNLHTNETVNKILHSENNMMTNYFVKSKLRFNSSTKNVNLKRKHEPNSDEDMSKKKIKKSKKQIR